MPILKFHVSFYDSQTSSWTVIARFFHRKAAVRSYGHTCEESPDDSFTLNEVVDENNTIELARFGKEETTGQKCGFKN